MLLALLLHIYQPSTQFPEVLKVITEKSYLRIIELLKRYPEARLSLNIPAALTEQLEEHGFNGLLSDLRELVRRGQVELTGSAAYHPLLFKLPEAEIIRQIKLNEGINRRFFGDLWAPRGFFPPEMAVNERVLKVIETCGYEWVVLEQAQNSIRPGRIKVQNEMHRVFLRAGGDLKILFRDREAGLGVAFGKIKTVKDLLERSSDFSRDKKRSSEFTRDPNRTSNFSCDEGIADKSANSEQKGKSTTSKRRDSSCLLLALDGETFGWHRPEQLRLLEELVQAADDAGRSPKEKSRLETGSTRAEHESNLIELVTVSELINRLPIGPEIRVGKTSWGKRVEEGRRVFYPRWEDPGNEIHQMQWELTDLAIRSVNKSSFNKSINQKFGLLDYWIIDLFRERRPSKEERQWVKARFLLDSALHSDQYFWAEGKEVWHLGMVERGARMLKDVVIAVPDASDADRRKARDFYDRIVKTGKELHGEEVKE